MIIFTAVHQIVIPHELCQKTVSSPFFPWDKNSSKAEAVKTMASIAVNPPSSSSNHFMKDSFASFSTNRLYSFSFESSLFSSKIPTKQLSFSDNVTKTTRPEPTRYLGSEMVKASSHSFDVVIVGTGIIGLTIARQFLIGSDLSVAVVGKAVPCSSGATSAGEASFFNYYFLPRFYLIFLFFAFAKLWLGVGHGYIWMVHKNPGSETWELTKRSHQLWKNLMSV